VLPIVIIGVLLSARAAATEPAPPAGELLFRQYCASCHGLQGRGDGPAGGALCPPPPDLTRVRSEVPELMRQIDGGRTIRAHGTSAMPVWGEVFEQSLIDQPHKRRTALLQVKTLAEYVRSLQRRSAPD
jgi:mono/diheme cytochrome c family protein